MHTNDVVQFHGHSLKVVDHNGKRWFTAEQTGLALGYGRENGRKGVMKLYERHKDEFTDVDSTVVKLTAVDGKLREMRVFSDTGCNKLGFFANTAIAKEFRTFAADVLARRADSTAVNVTTQVPPPAAKALRVTRAIERQALELFVAGHNMEQIGKALGILRTSASLMLHAKYQFAPGAGESECTPELIRAVADRHLAVGQARLIEIHQRIANSFRATAHNQPLSTALDHVGRQLQQPPARAMLATPAREG